MKASRARCLAEFKRDLHVSIEQVAESHEVLGFEGSWFKGVETIGDKHRIADEVVVEVVVNEVSHLAGDMAGRDSHSEGRVGKDARESRRTKKGRRERREVMRSSSNRSFSGSLKSGTAFKSGAFKERS